MVSASIPAKIIKPPGEKVDEVETQVSQVSIFQPTWCTPCDCEYYIPRPLFNQCDPLDSPLLFSHWPQALLELESSSNLKNQLRELHISAVKEVEAGNKKVLIIFVPPPQLKAWQRIQVSVVRELEKKFSGKHVVVIAKRTILPKPSRSSRVQLKQKRPMSRTLTSVHDAYLSDIVYPAEVVGKRARVRLDGSRLYKIHLDRTAQTQVDHKIDTFVAVYKKLTGKDVTFEFPEPIFWLSLGEGSKYNKLK